MQLTKEHAWIGGNLYMVEDGETMRSLIRIDLIIALGVGLLLCAMLYAHAMRLDAVCAHAFNR